MTAAAQVNRDQRHSRRNPCPICQGADSDRRGRGERCWGYVSENGRWAYCSQNDGGGKVKYDERKRAYVHFLAGPCACGTMHGNGSAFADPPHSRTHQHTQHEQRDEQAREKRPFTTPPAELKGWHFKCAYLYRDGQGRVAFQVLRYERPDADGGKPQKRFLQARPINAEQWVMDLDGVTRVLYHEPELMAAPLDAWVCVPEGEKCVDAVRALGCVATCASGGAGKWSLTPDAAERFRGRRVLVLPDNDGPDAKTPQNSYAGQYHAKAVADDIARVAADVRVLALPDLPLKGDIADWIAAGGTKAQLLALASRAPHARDYRPPEMPGAAPNGPAWDDPLPLPEGLPAVDALDMALLPAPLRAWVHDIAERMQVPADFPAVGALVEAGALIGRRIGIYPKRQDDWLVVPNLWGAIVAPPSQLKSPALSEVMKPLDRLAAEANEQYREACADYDTDAMLAEARKAALADRMKKAAKAENEDELQALAAQARELKKDKPTLRRFKTNDGTVEKLGELFLENPDGLLAYRDELSGWLRTLDKQGHEGDRAFYLEAWNGTGSFNIDRIGRGSLHVPALCLSILGGIQPGPLAGYVYAASAADNAGNDGLLQRFQLVVWPDPPATWRNVDRWPNTEARTRAYDVFKGLAALTPEQCGAMRPDDDPDAIPALRFSAEAQDVFDAWRLQLETRLRSGELPPALAAHLAKYRSLMPSLALLFHLMDVADGTAPDASGGVSLLAAQTAAAWCEYLETHARRLYASAANPSQDRAAALFARLASGDLADGTPVREIYRKQWSRLTTPEEVESAIKTLEAYGWVITETVLTGGRRSTVLRVHPQARQKNGEKHQRTH